MLRSQRDCSTDVQEHAELATAGLHRKPPRTSQRNLQHIFGNPQNPGAILYNRRTKPPQNWHPFAIGQGSECNPTVAMPVQSFAILGIVVELHIPGDPITILFQTTPEANGLQSTQNRPSFATHSRLRHNRPKNNSNQTGSQCDCRTTKDGNAIDMIACIAGRLRQLHVTQGDQDQQSIEFAAIGITCSNPNARPVTRSQCLGNPWQFSEQRHHTFHVPSRPHNSRNLHAIPKQSLNPLAKARNRRTNPPESIEQAGALGGFVLPLRGDCGSQIRDRGHDIPDPG